MAAKHTILTDHMPKNKAILYFNKMIPLTPVNISMPEVTTTVVTLPDQTVASGGVSPPVEITFGIPAHHTMEIAALDAWIAEGRDPVSPTYKRDGQLFRPSGSNLTVRTWQIVGAMASMFKPEDFEMANEGEMNVVNYKINADEIVLLT